MEVNSAFLRKALGPWKNIFYDAQWWFMMAFILLQSLWNRQGLNVSWGQTPILCSSCIAILADYSICKKTPLRKAIKTCILTLLIQKWIYPLSFWISPCAFGRFFLTQFTLLENSVKPDQTASRHQMIWICKLIIFGGSAWLTMWIQRRF